MDGIHELFRKAKYDAIISRLHEHTTTNGLVDQLSRENSLVVCEYAKTSGNSSGKIKTFLSQFAEILFKCSSVPSKPELLSLELTVLYNYLYIHIKQRDGDCIKNMSLYRLVNRTLYRVCTPLPGFEKKRISLMELNPDSKSTSYAVLTVCLNSMLYGLQCTGIASLLDPFSDCCRLFLLHVALEKDLNPACTYLQKLKKIEESLDTSADGEVPFEKHLSLKFSVDHSQLFLTQSSKSYLTSFLIGCFQCNLDQWEAGLKHIDHAVENEDLKLAANITSGFGLYKLGRYSEAISVLLETLRSCDTMTQRLKATIYNLIGMCFDSKGKGQLSIQMYKEALSADFGFLRPLHNTSLQYRKLDVRDVELECLNLLVTALEMRVKVKVVDGSIDLLNLLMIHDVDITYAEALYTFANRSLQLQRYSVAADKYKQLLGYLQSIEAQESSCIPSVLQVYHEAILALLHANQLSDCLSLCNKVITCYQGPNTTVDGNMTLSGNSLDSSFIATNPRLTSVNTLDNSLISARQSSFSSSPALISGSRKRKRLSDSFTEDGCDPCQMEINMELAMNDECYDEDVVACKYKAEVLYKLGQHDAALASAQRAVDSISSYRKKLFVMKRDTDLVSESSPASQRKSKKARLITEAESSIGKTDSTSAYCIQGSRLNTMWNTGPDSAEDKPLSLCDKLQLHSQSSSLEYELYTLMGKILTEINQPADALHCQRLAMKIKPSDNSVSVNGQANGDS